MKRFNDRLDGSDFSRLDNVSLGSSNSLSNKSSIREDNTFFVIYSCSCNDNKEEKEDKECKDYSDCGCDDHCPCEYDSCYSYGCVCVGF